MHWAGHWAPGMAWVVVAAQQRIHVVFARAWSIDAIVPRLDNRLVQSRQVDLCSAIHTVGQ
jgi:hypothetical protein